ncbi:MAG: PAS domain S-box protein [Candidatus Omnitrophota bacterium]
MMQKDKRQKDESRIEIALKYANSINATLREPFLVLDKNLQVISTNQAFCTTFEVAEKEIIGRLLSDLGDRQWNIPKLLQLLKEIVPEKKAVKGYEVEYKFEHIGERAMTLNACQLRVPKKIATIIAAGAIEEELILLAIEDITERREIEKGLEKTRKELVVIKKTADEVSEFAESIINTVREPLISLDQGLRVVMVSRSFCEFFKVSAEETVGKLIYDLGNKQWNIPKLRELLETILPQKTTFDNYEVEHDFSDIGRRIMLLNARQIQRASGKERIILLAIEDITERKQAGEKLFYFKKAVDSATDAIGMSTPEGRHYYQNVAFTKLFGLSVKETDGVSGPPATVYADEKVGRKVFDTMMRGDSFIGEVKMLDKDRNEKDILLRAYSIKNEKGKVIGLVGIHTDNTERKKVEESYRAAIQTTIDGFWRADMQGNILDINDAYCKMLGYSCEEMLKMKISDVEAKESPEDIRTHIRKVKETGKECFETRQKRKDGPIIDVEISLTYLESADQMFVFVRDITERKKAEQWLRRLVTVVLDSNDAITIQDFEGNITAWNHGAELMYGYSEQEALQMNIGVLTPPDKMAEQNDFIRRIITGEVIILFETQRVTKDGRVLDAWLTVTKLVDDTGKPVGIASTERDITERKKMGERLLAAAEEWRTTFDSIFDMVSILDKDHKIIRVNKSFADRLKMKPEDVIGKTCYELVHGTNEPLPTCPHRGTLETKMPQHSEYFEPHLDMYLEVTTSPIFNEKGDIVASVHIARDISHRKKLEKNQRLSELGKLVADMAHEVNNPLMIISGNAQLSLLDGTLNEEIKGNLKIIHEETNRAKDIIQRLLKFSRPSKGECKEVDINQSIESVTKLIEYQFSLSDVRIKKDLKHDLPTIVIDEKQIQEVLMNLLNNARDAMPDGGTIDISTSLEQDFLRIDVKNSGMGMGEEALSRLFEPFFTTKEKGTGLGLAVCNGIVKGHNGELKFESQPGKGTTATVLLPIRGSEE